jgi:hypothetical protein
MHQYMTIEMPDGSLWAVPVDIIANNRAEYFADKYGYNVSRSLIRDTIPLFESNEEEIRMWAEGHMCWSDFKEDMILLSGEVDYEKGLLEGPKKFVKTEKDLELLVRK